MPLVNTDDKMTIGPPHQYLRIMIAPTTKPNWFGRLKTHLWNFILPPHIRLSVVSKKDKL